MADEEAGAAQPVRLLRPGWPFRLLRLLRRGAPEPQGRPDYGETPLTLTFENRTVTVPPSALAAAMPM